MRSGMALLCLLFVAAGHTWAGLVEEATRRAELVNTLRAKFRRTDVWQPGSVSRGQLKGMSDVPPKETTLESEDELALDGKKFRYHSRHPIFLMPSGKISKREKIGVTDAAQARTLFLQERPEQNWHTGAVLGTPAQPEAVCPEIQPVLAFCRGAGPDLCDTPLGKYRPSGRALAVGGAHCEEFVIERKQSSIHCWADPAANYCLRKTERREKGTAVSETIIEYRPNSTTGIFPARWRTTNFDDKGRVASTCQVEVLQAALNRPVDAALFALEFPPHTKYVDQRTGKEYVIDGAGKHLEHGPSGRPQAEREQQAWGPWQWGTVGTGLLLAIALVGLRAWFRRRAAPTAASASGGVGRWPG